MTVRHCFQPKQTIAAYIMYNLSPQVGLLGMRRELRNHPEGVPWRFALDNGVSPQIQMQSIFPQSLIMQT